MNFTRTPHSPLLVSQPKHLGNLKGCSTKTLLHYDLKKKLIENVTAHYTLQISTGLFSTALQSVFWGWKHVSSVKNASSKYVYVPRLFSFFIAFGCCSGVTTSTTQDKRLTSQLEATKYFSGFTICSNLVTPKEKQILLYFFLCFSFSPCKLFSQV